jgi:hypothetical protein
MKLKSDLFSTIALAIVTFTIGDMIAAPLPGASIQAACRQHGDYQYLYSFEAEDFTIAICKKGAQHYYLKLPQSASDAEQEATPSLNPTPTKPPRIYKA